jgi:hypothetical protein
LTTNALHPYVLTGDLNEDINRPVSTNQPVQRLISAPTGLQLTPPRNPFNSDDRTWSIQGGLSVRLDYLLPCSLLFSNIASSQIRTDLLTNSPPSWQRTTSPSDHHLYSWCSTVSTTNRSACFRSRAAILRDAHLAIGSWTTLSRGKPLQSGGVAGWRQI